MILFMMEALALAVLLDLLMGEPRPMFHPTVWIGTLIGVLKEVAPKNYRRMYGFIMAFFCIGIMAVAGYAIPIILYGISPLLSLVVTAYLLKSTFSLSFLWDISYKIYGYLKDGRLDAARIELPALVGRDVSKLDADGMSSCVIESLGESFVDGILSPLFYFTLFGLLGAMAYRAINTLDSMVGYKDEKHRLLGFASAKIDDLANYVPARLSVLIIMFAAVFYTTPISSLKTALRDGRKAPSTNSGFPMSAFAGALSIRLEKAGYYVLGDGLRHCKVSDIPRALTLNKLLTFIVVIIVLAALYFTGLPLLSVGGA